MCPSGFNPRSLRGTAMVLPQTDHSHTSVYAVRLQQVSTFEQCGPELRSPFADWGFAAPMFLSATIIKSTAQTFNRPTQLTHNQSCQRFALHLFGDRSDAGNLFKDWLAAGRHFELHLIELRFRLLARAFRSAVPVLPAGL